MIWKIVLVKVYFTDLSEYKIRPVYIFKNYDNEDYMFLPLSSNINRKWFIIDDSYLKNWSLKQKSVIIIPKIWIIHKSLILEEIWELNLKYVFEVSKSICNELWCK